MIRETQLFTAKAQRTQSAAKVTEGYAGQVQRQSTTWIVLFLPMIFTQKVTARIDSTLCILGDLRVLAPLR
jgi:hypothetical protein